MTGLKEVEAQLLKLGSVEGTKVLRAGMLQATRPIVDQAKANAAGIQKGSGSLERSIGRKFIVGRSEFAKFIGTFSQTLPNLGGAFTVQIAPIKSSRVAIALHNLFYKRKRRGIFHGHFLEFGTQRSKRIPFLRPAIDARGAQAVQELAGEIKAGIEKLLAKKK